MSNWQFDSRSLKVGYRFNFVACRCHVTYPVSLDDYVSWFWKDLNKGYNFALDLISIGGLHMKLWCPKIVRVPTLAILELPLGSPEIKCHLDVSFVEKHKVYFKGKVVVSPKFSPWWVLWVWVCSWFILAPKVFKLCTNQLVV